MSGSAKSENTVNIIIEAGEFTFNDSLDSAEPLGRHARRGGPRRMIFAAASPL